MFSARILATWARRSPRFFEIACSTLVTWQKRAVMRRAFVRMETHMLRDIGLTAWEAQYEAQKPFWRA